MPFEMPTIAIERSPCASELSISTLQKLDRLTQAEIRVLKALLETGYTNAKLGEYLNLVQDTVHNHLYHIRRKLKVKTTVSLFKMFPEFTNPGKTEMEQSVVTVTRSEKAIADLIDLSNSEIGKILHISKRTVETHLSNLFSKCYVKNRREFIFKRSRFVLEVGRGA